MGKREKLIERFKRLPKDFTFEEMLTLMSIYGYKGATSGSRVRFRNVLNGAYVDIHRPHPGSIMKAWMMKTVFQHLKDNGLLK